MRELSIEDVQDVSGGNDLITGSTLIIAGVTIAKAGGILGALVSTAFVALPAAALFSVGLVGLGGYHLGRGIGTVTIGPDHSASSGRDSDC